MSVAHCLENYLCQAHVEYDVVHHSFTNNAYDSACSAHVPISNMVKAVMLRERDCEQYVLATAPACNKLKLPWINKELHRDLILAEEQELSSRFPDCTLGAVPGFGQAYGLETIWDDQLAAQPNLYFEAGDHEDLIHIDKQQFSLLFGQLPHSVISLPVDNYSIYHADELRDGMH